MKAGIIPSYKRIYFGVMLLSLFSLNTLSLMVVAQLDTTARVNTESEPIRLVQTRLERFNGVNSIMAQTSNSVLGVLYGTADNAFPLSLFTDFTQKLAEIEFQNHQGTIINRTQLMTRNTFLVKLVSIIEYEVGGNDNRFNSTQISPNMRRIIDLSNVKFNINASRSSSNESDSQLTYHIDFFANQLEYRPQQPDKLDSLVISLDFYVEKTRVSVPTIPKIRIRSDGTRFTVTRASDTRTIEAIRFAPQIKFSCNIDGWDFSTPTSQLILRVDFLAHEEILGLGSRIGNLELTREVLKRSELLGELKFSTLRDGQSQNHILDQSNIQKVNYTVESFTNNQFSLGNSLRDYLRFTWINDVVVDGDNYSIRFQPLSLEPLSMSLSQKVNPLAKTILLRGGFLFPQGNSIHYDPEIQVEELNPIFKILPAPNRVILENSSQIILISGFFVGILIIIRQRFYQ